MSASSTRSRGLTYGVIAAGVIGVACIATAAGLSYTSYKQRERERMAKKKIADAKHAAREREAIAKGLPVPERKKKPKVTGPKPRKTPADVPLDADLLAEFKKIFPALEAAEMDPFGPEAMKLFDFGRRIEPSEYSHETRIWTARYLMQHYNIQVLIAMQQQNQPIFFRAQQQYIDAFPILWKLVDFIESPEDVVLPYLYQIRLEVAQRMRPDLNLAEAWEKMNNWLSHEGAGAPEELQLGLKMSLILQACTVGRWHDFLQLCEELFQTDEEREEKFMEFHAAALQAAKHKAMMPTPDLKTLHSFLTGDQGSELVSDVPEAKDLKWKRYRLKAVKLKLRKANHKDGKTKEAKIERDSKLQPATYQDLIERSYLQRRGAVADMLSLSPLGLPVYGPMTDTKLHMEQSEEVPEDPTRQVERYDLEYAGVEKIETRSVEALAGAGATEKIGYQEVQVWTGTYTMTQVKIDSGKTVVELIYDCGLHMIEEDLPPIGTLVPLGNMGEGKDDGDDEFDAPSAVRSRGVRAAASVARAPPPAPKVKAKAKSKSKAAPAAAAAPKRGAAAAGAGATVGAGAGAARAAAAAAAAARDARDAAEAEEEEAEGDEEGDEAEGDEEGDEEEEEEEEEPEEESPEGAAPAKK